MDWGPGEVTLRSRVLPNSGSVGPQSIVYAHFNNEVGLAYETTSHQEPIRTEKKLDPPFHFV